MNTVKHPRPIIHATLQPGSADGIVFVPSCDDDIIRLFDLRQSVTGILLNDFNFLLSHTFCSWFSTLVVITFFPVVVLRGHRSSVYAVRFNHCCNDVLAFAGAEKTIKLWTPVAQQLTVLIGGFVRFFYMQLLAAMMQLLEMKWRSFVLSRVYISSFRCISHKNVLIM